MHNCFVTTSKDKPIAIIPVCKNDFANWLNTQTKKDRNILKANMFTAEPNTFCLITNSDGELEKVVLGITNKDDYFGFGILPKVLPDGCYEIHAPDFSEEQLERAAIGWGMGSYQFTRYKKPKDFKAVLFCNKNYDLKQLTRTISSIFLVRDLINTPAAAMYPERLADAAFDLANKYKAELRVFEGEDLINDFPAVYAVGQGSEKKPLLIDMRFGDKNGIKVALVGKGVCFDSGGLQLKRASGPFSIELMKRDMAGAANVLGLAQMIMDANLPINLRVIIPAVENLPSGSSLKPGDIIKTRNGTTLEIGNTDAEGRLILADALTLASEWHPEFIFDFATLTGAARIALGPDISALFSNNDKLAQDIIYFAAKEQDPIWQMPLYEPYLELLKSEFADFRNVPVGVVGGGAITAALILKHFVSPGIKWVHFDIDAYNDKSKPAKPEGGEAACIVGLFKYIKNIVTQHPFSKPQRG